MSNDGSAQRPAETGWLPDTPVDDTLLRQFLHNQAEVCDVIAEGFAGDVVRTPEVALAASSCVVPYLNEALLFRPLHDGDDGLLDEIERFFAASAAPSWVLLSAWPTPPLSGRGWQLVGHPAFVVRSPGASGRRRLRALSRSAVRSAMTARRCGRRRAHLRRGLPDRRRCRPPRRRPSRLACRHRRLGAHRISRWRRRRRRNGTRGARMREPLRRGHVAGGEADRGLGCTRAGSAAGRAPTCRLWRSRATTRGPDSSTSASSASCASRCGCNRIGRCHAVRRNTSSAVSS